MKRHYALSAIKINFLHKGGNLCIFGHNETMVGEGREHWWPEYIDTLEICCHWREIKI
jgi:hypothetical protein